MTFKLPSPGHRLWLVLIGLAVLPAAVGFNDYTVSVLTGALLIGLLGQAWSLMARCGLVSLGHAAFFGIGAYGAAAARMRGLPLAAALGLGGLLALIFSLAFVGLAGRLKGAYFALATLVIVALPKALALNWSPVTGGAGGLLGIPSFGAASFFGWRVDFSRGRLGEYYLLFLVILGLGTLIWWLLHRSRFGLASLALRQDAVAARSLGISPLRYQTAAILASALFTGIGGGFYAFQVRYIEPHYLFGLHFSIIPLVAATFGGLTTGWGPLLGALILQTADEFIFREILPASHEILYGLTLMTAILLFPRGIFKALMKLFGEEKIAYR